MILTRAHIEQHLDWLNASGASPNTTRAYRADLEGLLHDWEKDPVDEGFELIAARYLTKFSHVVAPRTTRRRLATFRSFASYHGVDHPLHRYRAPTPAPLEAHPLPDGMNDVRRLLAATERPQERALIALCGLLGLRVSEATDVLLADFKNDGTDEWLMVRGKGRKERKVPVDQSVQPHLRTQRTLAARLYDGHLFAFGERQARKIITRVGARAGVKVASHDLRSTFATTVYSNTKDLRVTQDLLGHANPATTVGYTKVSDTDKQRAAKVI
jgi:integrase